jgi:hypothetical protein
VSDIDGYCGSYFEGGGKYEFPDGGDVMLYDGK